MPTHHEPPIVALPGPWLCQLRVAVVAARGPDARDLLQRLGTQDLRLLEARGSLPSLFVTHQGKLVAHTRILAQGDALWLVTDAAQGRTLRDWLEKYTVTEDATFEVLQERWPMWRLLAAPPAAGIAADLAGLDAALHSLAPFAPVTLRPPSGWGEGFDVLLKPSEMDAAQAAVAPLAALPLDSPLTEAARLSVGEPALGRDHAPLAPPLEWRLGQHSISWTKGCFVGQEVLSRLDSYNKVARLTMGVQGDAGAHALAAAPHGTALRLQRDGAAIGKISTFAARPGGGDAFMALALVKREAAIEGPARLCLPGIDDAGAEVALLHRPFWGP